MLSIEVAHHTAVGIIGLGALVRIFPQEGMVARSCARPSFLHLGQQLLPQRILWESAAPDAPDDEGGNRA